MTRIKGVQNSNIAGISLLAYILLMYGPKIVVREKFKFIRFFRKCFCVSCVKTQKILFAVSINNGTSEKFTFVALSQCANACSRIDQEVNENLFIHSSASISLCDETGTAS